VCSVIRDWHCPRTGVSVTNRVATAMPQRVPSTVGSLVCDTRIAAGGGEGEVGRRLVRAMREREAHFRRDRRRG
jgi:hypothetical protein